MASLGPSLAGVLQVLKAAGPDKLVGLKHKLSSTRGPGCPGADVLHAMVLLALGPEADAAEDHMAQAWVGVDGPQATGETPDVSWAVARLYHLLAEEKLCPESARDTAYWKALRVLDSHGDRRLDELRNEARARCGWPMVADMGGFQPLQSDRGDLSPPSPPPPGGRSQPWPISALSGWSHARSLRSSGSPGSVGLELEISQSPTLPFLGPQRGTHGPSKLCVEARGSPEPWRGPRGCQEPEEVSWPSSVEPLDPEQLYPSSGHPGVAPASIAADFVVPPAGGSQVSLETTRVCPRPTSLPSASLDPTDSPSAREDPMPSQDPGEATGPNARPCLAASSILPAPEPTPAALSSGPQASSSSPASLPVSSFPPASSSASFPPASFPPASFPPASSSPASFPPASSSPASFSASFPPASSSPASSSASFPPASSSPASFSASFPPASSSPASSSASFPPASSSSASFPPASSSSSSASFSASSSSWDFHADPAGQKFYNFVVLHTRADERVALRVRERLEALGVPDGATFCEDFQVPGRGELQCLQDAIDHSGFLILLLTASFDSQLGLHQVNQALMSSLTQLGRQDCVVPFLPLEASEAQLGSDATSLLAGLVPLEERSAIFARKVANTFAPHRLRARRAHWAREQRARALRLQRHQSHGHTAQAGRPGVWGDPEAQIHALQEALGSSLLLEAHTPCPPQMPSQGQLPPFPTQPGRPQTQSYPWPAGTPSPAFLQPPSFPQPPTGPPAPTVPPQTPGPQPLIIHHAQMVQVGLNNHMWNQRGVPAPQEDASPPKVDRPNDQS